jgi:2-keto-4-pentenoate hydratase/2-oxohepta-3-ene-1,7-dioic acid hydratase in catechol pathway
MKLLRHGPLGGEMPGIVDEEGVVRSLEGVVPDIGVEQLSHRALAALRAIDPSSLPRVKEPVRYAPPIAGARKFIGIGFNYIYSTTDTDDLPKEPIFFLKAINCLQGAMEPVMLPRDSSKTDWEVELGVVIGTTASYVSEGEALAHVAGYCVVNDISEREYQMERGGTWDKGKGCDTFGPAGPWLVTADEIPDPKGLDLWLDVNGERMQQGNTRDMIFSVAKIVSYVSEFMVLEAGDIICTGTPPGAAIGKNPPCYLRPGDVMELGIQGLGRQRQEVIGWRRRGLSSDL